MPAHSIGLKSYRRIAAHRTKLGFCMKTKRFALLALLILAAAVPAFSTTSFTPTGIIDMIPTSMSDDASIVVGTGTSGVPNLYYTEAGGAVVIGDGCFSGLPAISGDGTTVLGCHTDEQGLWNAARWLGGTSWLDLGTVAGGIPCDFFLSGAYGVNQDGSLAVGLLYLATLCRANAGTWDLTNGDVTVLPAEFGETAYTRANAVNGDGSVIVGWQDQPTGERTAARWVKGVEEVLLTPNGEFNGEAHAVSADGNTIVGGSYALGEDAWIWQPQIGVRPIFGEGSLTALDVSDDGNVVVGFSSFISSQSAFICLTSKAKEARDLLTFLKSRGAVVPDGWRLIAANLISADGNIIYGWGLNPDNLVEMYKVVLDLNVAPRPHPTPRPRPTPPPRP
jgi:uncharacterized membrane protein